MNSPQYEVVIGLEVHVQLNTSSKIFARSSAAFGGEPNEFIDPVTLGLPGALPVCNRRVVDSAIMVGLGMGCQIRRLNRFARKHYFYPDLPKGYQISQFDEPICERGSLTVRMDDGTKREIGITRIHMEEDAGKNIHDTRTETSLVDLNRAGVPLLEIVSEPDLRSPAEAAAYVRTVRQLVRFLGVSDGNMEEGSLRCDANISLRPVGTLKFGTRTEIKNLNSFKFIERALEYEIARQTAVLQGGGSIVQETLLFDSANGSTRLMRSKEESSDYRYFPDPDLPPLVVEESWVERIRREMPRLPEQWAKELVEVMGLTPYDAGVLTAERANAEYFNEVALLSKNPRGACNWVTTELFGMLNKHHKTLEESPISAKQLAELVRLVDEEVLSGKMAKIVFGEMFATGRDPGAIIEQKGLRQITNDEEITKLVGVAFEKYPQQAAEFVGGNDRLRPFFVGKTMEVSGGSANPKKVNEAITRELTKHRGAA